MTADDLETLFYQHLPLSFVERILRAVFMAHRVAWDECHASFAETEARNVLGYYRRGKLEGYIRDTAVAFPGVDAVVERAEGSSWNHTEVRSGPVVLTENSVQTPCALVDKAEFRLTLARSMQLSIFDDPAPEEAPFYALLLHSRSKWEAEDERRDYGHLPGSAYIAFPARALDSYLHEINLFALFPGVVAAHLPQEWNHDAQLRYLRQARKVATA